MSALRRRVLALDRQAAWLETNGLLRWCELQLKYIDLKQRVIRGDPEFAARMGWKPAPPEPPAEPPPAAPPPSPPPRPAPPHIQVPPPLLAPSLPKPPPTPSPRAPPPKQSKPWWEDYLKRGPSNAADDDDAPYGQVVENAWDRDRDDDPFADV